jgi:site-specific DNA-methyltransferase (adenine-specific)
MSYVVINESCLDALKNIPDNSIDSIVTDPPYGLSSNDYVADTIAKWIAGDREFIPNGKGFMGKAWDAFVPPPAVWDECLRVLKPGGHLLAFFGSRTQDIGALSIRLAGFEIRDTIAWLYSSGFPKSHNISKAIDKVQGGEVKVGKAFKVAGEYGNRDLRNPEGLGASRDEMRHVADTNNAKEWEGWGTALKPSFEPIIVARKPLIGTVVENVLQHGTGGMNIDASRIGSGTGETKQTSYPNITGDNYNQGNEEYPNRIVVDVKDQGRWPANTVFSHTEDCVQTGFTEETYVINKTEEWTGFGQKERPDYESSEQTISTPIYECVDGCSAKELENQVPGASRFFYVSKVGKKERNEGLGDLPDHDWRNDGAAIPQRENRPFIPSKNHHPTVKPIALMTYLVRLVTPPNGTVLDPFTGSGSTGVACIKEGFNFIGIELTPEYIPIIEARLAYAENQMQEEDDLFGSSIF